MQGLIQDERVQVWLVVPFSQKERAKAKGAAWHSVERRWYAPHGVDLMGLRAWWTPELKAQFKPISEALNGKRKTKRKRKTKSRTRRAAP